MNIKENPKSKYISFRVPEDTKIAFKKVADKMDMKMSDIMYEFVDSKLKDKPKSKKRKMNRLVEDEINTPKHYDNTNGSLYKVAQERGWNSYLFDIVKRLERAEKKGEFKQDLEKSINVIKLWQNEN